MQNYSGSLIELPRRGKALVITDIHGNLDDFESYMDIWDEFKHDPNNHLILAGDLIHSIGIENDGSVEILDYVKSQCEHASNFHVLMGNHEWSTVCDIPVFKGGVNQTFNFEVLLRSKFGEKGYREKLYEYVEFFKKLPIAVRTANKVFITHAGPAINVKSLDEIKDIIHQGFDRNFRLYQLLWNRWDDFDKKQLESFLKAVDCRMMIAGHTPVDGAKLIYDKLLIVSSGYSRGRKAYVELDLKKDIEGSDDLLAMVKYVE